jgi:hypothetical protein
LNNCLKFNQNVGSPASAMIRFPRFNFSTKLSTVFVDTWNCDGSSTI